MLRIFMIIRGSFCYFLGALLVSPAFADQATTSFMVTATILKSCSVNVTGGTLSFGNYNPIANTALPQTTSVNVTCTATTTYDIGLGPGDNSSDVAVRKMASNANRLNYSLYTDTNHTTVWGNEIGTNTQSGTGSGSSQPYTIYGQIMDNQITAPPGSYFDNVAVTVTY